MDRRQIYLDGGVLTARRIGSYDTFRFIDTKCDKKERSVIVHIRATIYPILMRIRSLEEFERVISNVTRAERLTPVVSQPHPPRPL